MNFRYRLGIYSVMCLLVSACSGGSGTPQPPASTPPPPVTKSYTFPSGDATASSGTAWDIIGVKTTLSGTGNDPLGNSYDTLRVDVTFAQDISNALPAPGSPLSTGGQLGLHVGIDTDANPMTGYFGACAIGSHPFEYDTDQGNSPNRLMDGNYSLLSNGQPVYSGASNPDAEAAVQLSPKTIGFTFRLATIGVMKGSAIPQLGIRVASFNGTTNSSTDCVPSNTFEVFTQ